MKRLSAVAMASTAVLVSGCGSTAGVSTSALKPVAAKTLTVCTSAPYEPFEFTKDGQDAGIDIDLGKAVAHDFKYGFAVKQEDNFDSIFDDLDKGDCDLIASAVSITDERKKANIFSDGYFEVNQSLLVRTADKAKYTDLASLSGHKIAVQDGTTGADYAAANATGAQIIPSDDAANVFKALNDKTVDAVVQDFPVNSYYAQNNSSTTVVRTFTDVEREQYGFVMKIDNAAMQTAVNKALANIRKDGRYDKILSSYLGSAQ